MAVQLEVCPIGVTRRQSLTFVLLVAACEAFPCSVTDGSGASTAYPCVCGTDVCATGEVCRASFNTCEVIRGYYETERLASSCPSGYQVITDAIACQEVAEKISSKTWGAVYSYTNVPYGCGTRESNTVIYNFKTGGANMDVENSLLCIRTSFRCDVRDGSGVSSSYPCVCGTDTCATGEVCTASANRCEVIKGYYETEREASSCPSGYQVIRDAAACREVAGKIGSKTWGAVYSSTTEVHGCGTWLGTQSNTVNYYVNHDVAPGATIKDVKNALLCIDSSENSSLICDVTDGSGVSSSYPCVCGTDTCATGEVCIESVNRCEVTKGYFQTDRRIDSCPSGYEMIDEAACWELNNKLGKTWMQFPIYSGVAPGCGTWNFDTVSYFGYPGGGAPNETTNSENSLLCVGISEVISYNQCENPYTWGACH